MKFLVLLMISAVAASFSEPKLQADIVTVCVNATASPAVVPGPGSHQI